MAEESQTRILQRTKEVMDRYVSPFSNVKKTIEYEFGDRRSDYKEGDILILYNDLVSNVVKAEIKSIELVDRSKIDQLKSETIQAIGARGIEELKGFINQRGGKARYDTMLRLKEPIEILDKRLASADYPELKANVNKRY